MGDLKEAVVLGVDMVIWREELVSWIEELAVEIGTRARVHVKLDSGMGRFGTRDPEEASRVAAAALASPNIDLVGLMTHFATADELGSDFFDVQLERFERWARPIKQAHPEVLLHAANSAAMLRDPRAHFDMVRCGIALYGMDPFGEDPLRPPVWSPRSSSAPMWPRSSSARWARAPAMDGTSSPTATRSSRCCQPATAMAGAAGSPTTARSSSTAAGARWWGG